MSLMRCARAAVGRSRSSSRADGEVLRHSAAIVAWCDRRHDPAERLLPAGPAGVEAARWQARLDDGLGPDARLWMYESTLPVLPAMAPYVLDGTPRWEHLALRFGRRALEPFIRRYLGVSPESAAAAMVRVEATFDAIAAQLADGRPYLCGERFTAADLTFAALAAAVLVPAGYGSALPPLDELPPAMADEVRRLRAHPAGAFALRLYADERRLPE